MQDQETSTNSNSKNGRKNSPNNGHWPSNHPPENSTLDQQRKQWREQYAKSDADAGIEIGEGFEPFNQINDMFTRAFLG